MANWTCLNGGTWDGPSPDFSDCVYFDLTDFIDDLNNDTSVPSEVIEDVTNSLDENDQPLSSGDVIALTVFLDDAVEVRNQKDNFVDRPNVPLHMAL